MRAPEFSRQLFEELCGAIITAGYEGRRLNDPRPPPDRLFFLRHDVDISPRNALTLGKIAADRGIQSNFFFQFNAETYQLFSSDNLSILSELKALGHLVGLHVDQTLLGQEEKPISRTLDWFRAVIAPIDRAISFHRPTPAVLGRSYASFISAYDPRFFHPGAYMSDSRRSLDFLESLHRALAAGEPMLQLLLHPEWWSASGAPDDLWQALCDRRRYELFRYVHLNFTRVFADVEAIEDRDFGI